VPRITLRITGLLALLAVTFTSNTSLAQHAGFPNPNPFLAWRDLGNAILENRCETAFCFGGEGEGMMFAVEPMLDLPIGKSFIIHQKARRRVKDLGRRVAEGDALNLSLQAGARLWIYYDLVSIGALFLNVSLKKDIPTGDKTFGGSALATPAPGVVIGFFADIIQLSLFRFTIRNDGTDYDIHASDGRTIAHYAPYAELSSGWMGTLSFAPFTALRNLGGFVGSKKAQPAGAAPSPPPGAKPPAQSPSQPPPPP